MISSGFVSSVKDPLVATLGYHDGPHIGNVALLVHDALVGPIVAHSIVKLAFIYSI